MRNEYIEDIKEILKLTKEEKQHLKKSGIVYSLFSVAEISATIVFSCFKMPAEAVVCGLTSISCVLGTVYLKLEEKQTDKEIKKYEEKLRQFEK